MIKKNKPLTAYTKWLKLIKLYVVHWSDYMQIEFYHSSVDFDELLM